MSIAHARAAVRIEPTDADLRAAWARLRRADWPESFEEVMEQPVLGRMVRMSALHPPRATEPKRHPWPFMASRAHRLGVAPLQPIARVYDIKRAAAGDRDD